MAAETLPVLTDVVRTQRRSLALWALALAAVTAMYISFYPSIGGADMDQMIANLPEGVVTALGYDQIGTPGGYLSSTVYDLLGPILLLVFAIANGARLIAGEEEDGSLELDLTAPISRRRLLLERLAALWLDVVLLVGVLVIVTLVFVAALGIEVGAVEILAGASGLLLLVLGFGTVALAVGALTGRRALALGVAAGLAVVAYMLNAIGPTVGADWMTTVSPFGWYLGEDPLINGFDLGGLALLACIPIVAAAVALVTFDRRDLMV